MKKGITLLLVLTLLVALAAPSAFAADETELIVFAAASMTETMNQIKELYEAENPGITLVYNFDSSGTLKTQIQEGADCDVFISAAPKQMNALDASCDAEKNPDGLDFVMQGSRINLLENKVVLAVPEGNPKGIESFDQLAELLELAKAGCLTYGTNVKEVTTQVSEASVDCGVVYATDAFSAGLDSVDAATAEMCGQVVYPAAVLNISKNTDAAQAFLDYLTGPEATAVFESVGFTAMTEEKGELVVFAAASMTETLNQIKELYEAAHPGVTLVYNFDSSGTLKTQIQEGADCDVFISAAPKQMNALDASCDAEKNPDGLDFVLQGSRINLLENKVVLAVPEGNPKGIESFDQLAELLCGGAEYGKAPESSPGIPGLPHRRRGDGRVCVGRLLAGGLIKRKQPADKPACCRSEVLWIGIPYGTACASQRSAVCWCSFSASSSRTMRRGFRGF